MTDWRKISVSPEYASRNVDASCQPCQPCQPEEKSSRLARLSRLSCSAQNPKSPGLPVNDDPQEWLDAFEERAAIREFDGLYPRAEAEALAFGEVVNQWHFQHAVITQDRCAGCGHPAEGDDVIRLADGADVHLGCVRAYGLKWRRAASDALVAMGLTIPAGWSI